MTVKNVYQVYAFVVEQYGGGACDYEFTVVATTNKHFARMVLRMYKNMADNDVFTPYLEQLCNEDYYVEDFYMNTLKCFM